MIRSGGPHRRGRLSRVLGTSLGLVYLYASAAGAAGVGGCIHADHGGGESHGHGTVAAVSQSGAPQHSSHSQTALPCAAGIGEAAGDSQATPHHGAADPCDCLGDCSVETGAAEAADGHVLAAEGSTRADTTLPGSHQIEVRPDQHRLPYPNAPPLFQT